MESREFEQMIVAMRDRVYRLARSMLGSGTEADDAVHDVLERVWRRGDELRTHPNVEALLLTATRNHCIDRLRRRRVSVPIAGIHERGEENHSAEIGDMNSAVAAAMAALPLKQRMVMHLRDVEGLEFGEIAKAVQIDETAVRVNLSRARKTVREKVIKIMNYGL